MLQGMAYATQDTWILQTLQSLQKYDISIHSSFGGLIQWCQNDISLMERLALFYSGSSLAILNKVRLYLKVVTLSDIITANGQAYDVDFLHGRRGCTNPTPSSNRYIWPSIPEPSNKRGAGPVDTQSFPSIQDFVYIQQSNTTDHSSLEPGINSFFKVNIFPSQTSHI